MSTWMYWIALNTAITHFKKEKRAIKPISVTGIYLPDLYDSGAGAEGLQQLTRAIEHLDKADKSVILLYLEEKRYEEISEITGLSKSNVGVRINRIKTKLSQTLNP